MLGYENATSDPVKLEAPALPSLGPDSKDSTMHVLFALLVARHMNRTYLT